MQLFASDDKYLGLSVAVKCTCKYSKEIIKEMILIAITTFLKALINDFLDKIYTSVFKIDSISTQNKHLFLNETNNTAFKLQIVNLSFPIIYFSRL